MTPDHGKIPICRYSGSAHEKMLCHLMQNKSSGIDAELEKDRCKGSLQGCSNENAK